MEQSNVLNVQMFGNYQIHYDGRPLTGGKLRDTHFTSLMQILLHNVSTGVSRNYLEDVLFGDRDVENRQQALQTIVYKAKKKLREMELPGENYIFLEKGIYYWTPQIPVKEDAAIFDGLYRQAEDCEEKREKLGLYLEACYTYQGEFLSMYTANLWVSAEARRYRKQFFDCVEKAANLLRKEEDWRRLEELGRYATDIEPFLDWECLIMEALIERGRYEEARRLYADTADSYMKEQGISPSAKMLGLVERLGNQMKHPHAALDRIQQNLSEEPERVLGGYECSYPVFCGIYHSMNRMMERGGQSVFLMLATLVDSKGNPISEGKHLEEQAERLKDSIKASLRHGDIVNHYGNGQFLILLTNITRENCEVVKRRINQNFMVGRQRIGVQYHINQVFCDI